MEGDDRACGGEGHGALLVGHRVLARLEWQVEHRQREQHLGEIVRCVGEMRRKKSGFAVVPGIVEPESTRPHQAGDLLVYGQVVVVVFGPFLRAFDVAIERTLRQLLAIIHKEFSWRFALGIV